MACTQSDHSGHAPNVSLHVHKKNRFIKRIFEHLLEFVKGKSGQFLKSFLLFLQSSAMQMMSEEDRQQMEEELKRNLPQVLYKQSPYVRKQILA